MAGKMNKTYVLILALIMVFSVMAAGCSGNNKGSDSTGSNSAVPDNGSSDSNKPKDKVKITFWHVWSDKDSGPITARVKAFNESQNAIEVEVLGNQDSTKQLTAISGGNPPDVALTYWNNIGPWADAGAVLSLEAYFKKDNYDLNQYIPAALERMIVNGEHYGLPFTMSMASTLMYNVKVFEEAGLTSPPETLEQLFDYAKQLTKRDASGNITRIGFIPDYPWIDNVFWPIIFGGSWVDDKGKLTANQAMNVASIAYQRKFYEEFGVDQIGKFRSGMGQRGTPQDPLLVGQLAMMIGWEYNFPEERAAGTIGIAPFPYPQDRPDLKNSGMIGPRAVFIPKKAKHADEAWEFVKYLLSADSQVAFVTDSKTIPTIKSVLDDPRLTKNEDLKPMWDFYERAKSKQLDGFPNSVYINEYLQALSEQTEKALKGNISPQEAMDKVVEKVQPIADKK